MSNQVLQTKYVEILNYKQQLQNVSGLYCFHVNSSLKYVGKTKNFWNRFKNGYLKKDSNQHCNYKLMELIKIQPNNVEVIFKPMINVNLKEQESLFIQDYIPLFNQSENPRYEIRSIQRVIGRIVNKSNHEWTYNEMKGFLFQKWNRNVSLEYINEALKSKTGNLSRYCSINAKLQILKPKK